MTSLLPPTQFSIIEEVKIAQTRPCPVYLQPGGCVMIIYVFQMGEVRNVWENCFWNIPLVGSQQK